MTQLKYEQIADSLRQRITDGEFAPGAVLPSGRDLCEQWGVSRATVIKAMDVLRADGLVVARQGSGFTVTQTPLARPAGQRSTGSTRLDGAAFRILGTPTRDTPPAHVAAALSLTSEVTALRRTRLVLLADGTPFSLVTAWFPPQVVDACPRLAQEEPIAEGTTRYVTRSIGRSPSHGTDVTTVRLASEYEANHLDLQPPAAVAAVLHVAYDRDGRALVCEEGVTPAELWQRVDTYPMGTNL